MDEGRPITPLPTNISPTALRIQKLSGKKNDLVETIDPRKSLNTLMQMEEIKEHDNRDSPFIEVNKVIDIVPSPRKNTNESKNDLNSDPEVVKLDKPSNDQKQ